MMVPGRILTRFNYTFCGGDSGTKNKIACDQAFFFRDRVGGQGKGKPFPLASKTKRAGVPET